MLYIDDEKNIHLTRGDSANITVIITDMDGETYEIKATDTVLFTVKINCNTENIIIQKTIGVSGVISLLPEDTEDLKYGTYYYDVQLETQGGSVYTVLGVNKFILEKEVTFNE